MAICLMMTLSSTFGNPRFSRDKIYLSIHIDESKVSIVQVTYALPFVLSYIIDPTRANTKMTVQLYSDFSTSENLFAVRVVQGKSDEKNLPK